MIPTPAGPRMMVAGIAILAAAVVTVSVVHATGTSRASAPVVHPAVAHPVFKARPVAAPSPVRPETVDTRLVVKRVLTIAGPFRHGDYVWDDKGVPPGPLVITIDLAAETMSVFRGGYEIGAAVILYGADDKPTPLGGFRITQKDAHHRSNLYDAPMPYMMRLTNDGITIHGAAVETERATHGCVGVPTKFAAMLFGQAKVGDRVIITNGKMLHMGEAITRS